MKRLLMCFLLAGSFAFAQEAKVLTLQEAVSYALENKADAEKSRLDIEKGDAQIAEVRANALPQLSISGGTTFNPLLQENVLPGEIFGLPGQSVKVAFGQEWTSNVNAQLTQVLFNQSVFTGLKAAKSTKEFYLLNKDLTEEQIIEKVATAYYQVYQTEQMLENLQSNLELTEQTVDIVQGLYDNGLAKKIDFDRTRVALNNLAANRQQLINAVQLSQNALKFMIGMPIEEAIALPEETFDPGFLPETNNDFMDDRTEIKLINKQLELLTWQKKATQAEYYPSASLVANYGWLGQGPEVPLWNGEDEGVFWGDMSSVGVNIQIPIFNGFGTKSRVKQDKIEIEKAEADLRETKLALQLGYRNALAQLENSLITIKNQLENVELAQEVFNDTQNNYSLGLASLNDMLDAERDLADSKNNLTNARLDYKLAEVELLKSQGKLRTLNINN
jgi:outer membrane protein TolC